MPPRTGVGRESVDRLDGIRHGGLQNTEANINSQTQNITANGHYQVSVPLPSLSKTFSFDLGLDAFLKAAAVGNVHAEIRPTLTIAFDVTAGVAAVSTRAKRVSTSALASRCQAFRAHSA